METLQVKRISRVQATQRAGRAGRTAPGKQAPGGPPAQNPPCTAGVPRQCRVSSGYDDAGYTMLYIVGTRVLEYYSTNRAGRHVCTTCDVNRCVRLYGEKEFTMMEAESVPEIQRKSLEDVVRPPPPRPRPPAACRAPLRLGSLLTLQDVVRPAACPSEAHSSLRHTATTTRTVQP